MSATASARRHRAAAAGTGVLLVLALAWQCACHDDGAAAPAAEAIDLRQDRRIAPLLGGCAQGGFYDRDLSDLAPVLVLKLEHARPDPLKRAKEELGLLGARAFPQLGNAFHAYYADMMRSPFLENVVDALAFNASDEAHELELEALRHPQESVRSKSLDGLERHARPGDFDVLVERLAIETKELRRQSVAVLFRADRARAESLFLDFIERGAERDLWLDAASFFAETDGPETARRCAALFPGLEPLLAASIAAGAARNGHEVGLAHLRAELRSEDRQRRVTAASALSRAALIDELGPALSEDAAVEVRVIAAAALRSQPLTDQRRTWLRAALSDASEPVQSEALLGLCDQDDPEALARALAQLDGHPGQLLQALQALRAPLKRDARLAGDALARLLQRHALEEHRPIQQRAATYKAIGQMPLAGAAEFLHRTGLAAGAERIESLRAHEWLMIQAANTDIAGRTFLAETLRGEADPERRLDLIDAVGAIRDDLARTFLLEVVEVEARSPLERLFAASVLMKTGPSWEVAPRLKRVAFGMQAPDDVAARAGLQCLLWHWY